MRSKKQLAIFISIVQSILFLAHFFVYETWTFSAGGPDVSSRLGSKLLLGAMSVSFMAASLLAFRYTNPAVRGFYKIAAIWLGLLSFLFLGSVGSWVVYGIARLADLNANFHRIAEILLGAGAVAGISGLFNASWTRITRATVRLRNLTVTKILKEKPDAIFIAGDLYDGTAIDAHNAAEPLKQLAAPHGVYFIAGNHEQFGDDSKYLSAVAGAGVRVLSNEKVDVEG